MVRTLERLLAVGAASALVLLMLVVLIDVIGRNVFNHPLAAGTELTELLMVAVAFLSFPLLAWRQRDITVDLVDMLGGTGLHKYQVALAGAIGFVVFSLTARQLVEFAHRATSSGETTAQLKIPLFYAWWAMSGLAAVTAVAALVVAVAAFTRHPVTAHEAPPID